MVNNHNHLREFGKFRLDAERRVLWFEDKPVNLPLKEIELLCVLTENSGQVVTKDELLNKVWGDSFVEESNLSRHIYVLRKTFKDLGEADLIQTVPRRGYRFTGEVHENGNGALIIEKPSSAQTLIEELNNSAEPEIKVLKPPDSRTKVSHWRLKPFVVVTALLLLIAGGIAWNKSNILPQNQSEPVAPLTLQSMQVGR